jgi:tetratricopeptide (TPR) repeat protein
MDLGRHDLVEGRGDAMKTVDLLRGVVGPTTPAVCRVLVLLSVVATCSAAARAARAEESTGEAASAVELFEESERSYREGRFDRAVALLERAYSIDADPILLYNMARAYERMGDAEGALGAYRRYLERAPDAADREAVERRVAELEAAQAPDRPVVEEPPPPAAPAPDEAPARPERLGVRTFLGPLIVSGAGLLTIGAGLVLGGLSTSAHEDAVDDPDFLSAWDSQQTAERLALSANVVLAIGAAMIVGAAVWAIVTWLLHRRAGGGASATPGVRPGGP